MIMDTMRRGKSLGGLKHSLVLGEDRLEVGIYRGCVNCLNGMKSRNNARMTFSKDFFHSVGTDDLWRPCGDALELVLVALLLELHG
jgi:hypothetical protein